MKSGERWIEVEPARILLTALQRRGVRLQARNGKLRYTPRHLVDDETLQALREHKAAILAILEPHNDIEGSNNDIGKQHRYEEDRINKGNSLSHNDVTILAVDPLSPGNKEKKAPASTKNKSSTENSDATVNTVIPLEEEQKSCKTEDFSPNDIEKNIVSPGNNIVRSGIDDLSTDPRDHMRRGATRAEAVAWAKYNEMVWDRMREIDALFED